MKKPDKQLSLPFQGLQATVPWIMHMNPTAEPVGNGLFVVQNCWGPVWHIADANDRSIPGTEIFYPSKESALEAARAINLQAVERVLDEFDAQ